MKKTFLTIFLAFAALAGFSQTYLMNAAANGTTITTCSGTFYDSGGATGAYTNTQNIIQTFCSGSSNSNVSFTFSSFMTETNSDNLAIYDGPTISSPLLLAVSGFNPTSLINIPVISSGTCLTFYWRSSATTNASGWVATISCTSSCQPFTLEINNPSTPFYNVDTIHICQNTPLTLHVTGSYPNNNINYQQADNITVFTWDFGDASPIETVNGITGITHTWQEGAYYVTVKGKDINNCYNSNLVRIMVIVSLTPTFIGTNVSHDSICTGQMVILNGTHVQGNTWDQQITDIINDVPTFIPDGSGGSYQTSITNTLFPSGQTLPNASDISVCLNMEHSYFGDLTVTLECPNGTITSLFSGYSNSGNTASGSFLGEPLGGIDHDLYDNTPMNDPSVNLPGIGYDYCFSTSTGAVNLITSVGTPSGSSIPAGTYYPGGAFSNIVSCPLNGNWTIHVLDNLGIDNGYIFSWRLNINPALIPPQFTFTNTFDSTQFYWTGSSINNQSVGLGYATPATFGNNPYTLHVSDDFGCIYDTTIAVFVRPASAMQCCAQPFAFAGNDSTVFSLTTTLNAQIFAGSSGTWSVATGTPGIVTFANLHSQNSTVTVTQLGTYYFVWTVAPNIEPLCINTDTVSVTFSEDPLNINSKFILSQVEGQNSKFLIYPNPVSDCIFIQGITDHGTFEISDISGQIIKKGNINSSKISISTSEFSIGFYFVKVVSGNNVFIRKITRQL